MQVSALNLIIAAQQARSSTPPRAVAPQNAATGPAATAFAPGPFEPEEASPPPNASITAPLGSQIDIRV